MARRCWSCGIALAALVGLSRVYLRVHYLSDVNAGWALGVAAFAACGAVAMIVTHLRQNASRDAPPARASGLSTTSSAAPGVISLLAFAAFILAPAIGSYGRTWEKATAALLSLFVLAALLLLGRRARRPDRLLLGRHHADHSRAGLSGLFIASAQAESSRRADLRFRG